ncbi:phosphonate ABC transporter substrate-binding protein [Paenibacillus ihbetae]|uniref:Phosphonate ABC transporter substrate-binding protein n=1 Tax=Paenibacillus ihbetae TaxID=1870820 RepID=A0A1B2DZ63_9BACL|nr:PhnD/SsuA/transferrin family substrate-binding protein [Paenibacillus ihbetae]ANY72962.1 phosphonate ABC transporter substrate-binding protein [Paenibacillus ihbetae]
MKKIWLLMISLVVLVAAAGCGTNGGALHVAGAGAGPKSEGTITIAWLQGESGAVVKEARDELGKVIEKATGKQVEHTILTEDMDAIDAIANGQADLAFIGTEGYVRANAANPKVQPLVVASGETGTLEDAFYFSWVSVRQGEEGAYERGPGYALEPIAGKKISFVSDSSMSGFKVPAHELIGALGRLDKHPDLTTDDLLQGGKDRIFHDVLYGGTHPGSLANLLTGKADVAAFCDLCLSDDIELSSGTAKMPGAVYKVKADAAEPLHALAGKAFTIISVTPVLNPPFAINTDTVSGEDQQKLLDAFTSDEVSGNPHIFLPEDAEGSGLFKQTSGMERFLPVDDAWFHPIRELID